jgi:hypothetical protein
VDLAHLTTVLDVRGDKATVDAIEKVDLSLEKVGATAQRVGQKLSIFISAPLALIGKNAINTASDIVEFGNRVDVVFTESAAAVRKYSETTGEAIGVSQRDWLLAIGNFGNLFDTMGVNINGLDFDVATLAGDISGLSTEFLNTLDPVGQASFAITNLSTDLASFANVPVQDAIEDLMSGIVGMPEPLRKYGIVITEAAVKTKAYELGIAEAGTELTEYQKLQSRLAIILEQSGNAHGDQARTADFAANATRRLQAVWSDFMAQLGAIYLPIWTAIILKLTDVVKWLKYADPQFLKIAAILVVFGAALGPVIIGLGVLISAISAIITFGPIVAAVLGGLVAPVLLIIAVLAALYIAYRTNFLGFADGVKFLANEIAVSFAHMIDVGQRLISFFGFFKDLGQGNFEALGSAIASMLIGVETGFGPVDAVLRYLEKNLQNIGTAVDEFFHKIGQGVNYLKEFAATGQIANDKLATMSPVIRMVTQPLAAFASIFMRIVRIWREDGFFGMLERLPQILRVAFREFGRFIERLTGLKNVSDMFATAGNAVGIAIQKVVYYIRDAITIFQQFRSQGMDPLAAAIATLSQLLPFFAGVLSAVEGVMRSFFNVLAVGLSVIRDVINGFQEGGLSGAFDAFKERIPDLLEAFKGFFTALTGLYEEIGRALIEAFRAVPWTEIGLAIWEFLKGMFIAIPWMELASTLIGYAGALVSFGRDLIAGLLAGAIEKWPEVVTWLTGLKDLALAALPGVLSWLQTKGEAIMLGLKNGLVWLWTQQIAPWFSSLLTLITDQIPENPLSWLLQTGLDILEGLRGGIKIVWQEFLQPWLLGLWGLIKDQLPEPLGVLQTKGQAVITGLWNGIKWFWTQTIEPWIAGIWGYIKEQLPEPLTVLESIGKDIMTGMKTGIETVWGEISTFFSGLFAAVTQIIPDDWTSVFAPITAGIQVVLDTAGKLWDMLVKIGGFIPGVGTGDNEGDQGGEGSTPTVGEGGVIIPVTITVDGVATPFATFVDSVALTGRLAGNRFQEEIANGFVTAMNSATVYVNLTKAKFDEFVITMDTYGTNAGRGFQQKLADGYVTALASTDVMKNMISSKLATIQAALAQAGTAGGRSFAQGIASGMQSAVTNVDTGVAAIQRRLNFSGSGAGYNVGWTFGNALNNAIVDWIPQIVASAVRAVNDAGNAARAAAGRLNNTGPSAEGAAAGAVAGAQAATIFAPYAQLVPQQPSVVQGDLPPGTGADAWRPQQNITINQYAVTKDAFQKMLEQLDDVVQFVETLDTETSSQFASGV